MKRYTWLAALAVFASAGAAFAGDSWTINLPNTLSVTSGGGPSEYNATVLPSDWSELNIPTGTYHGLRLSYDWTATAGMAQPGDTGFSFFDPDYPALPNNRVGPYVISSPLVQVTPGETARITFDEPTFWVRSFYTEPAPIPGGRGVGARFNVWTRNSTVEWSNVEIELYEATMTTMEGDSYSSGSWYRPIINPRLGIDLGRNDVLTDYSVQAITVDQSGTYGIHTHFDGVGYAEAWTYLFEDEFDLTGDYDHIMDANGQGDWGVGYPDIKSVYMEAGRTYYLVQANEKPNTQYTYKSWICGPGNVIAVPEPGTLALLGLAGVVLLRRGR